MERWGQDNPVFMRISRHTTTRAATGAGTGATGATGAAGAVGTATRGTGEAGGAEAAGAKASIFAALLLLRD